MSRRVVILRPQPGADATADAARALGLEVVLAPLFAVEPLDWTAPDPAGFDALMLTSANAVRHAGRDLMRYAALPLFVVGAASARAARAAGLTPKHVGAEDAASLLNEMQAAGLLSALHLCGADVAQAPAEGMAVLRLPVYRATETGGADSLTSLLTSGDICLVHSPRAAARLAALVPPDQRAGLSLIAISDKARAAAGVGWASAIAAPIPTDAAMLALAEELCHKADDATPDATRRG